MIHSEQLPVNVMVPYLGAIFPVTSVLVIVQALLSLIVMVPACSPLPPLILAASMVQVTPSHSATVEQVPVFSIVTRSIFSIES